MLAYNGELYNDAEMRKALSDAGVPTHTHCDTETVLLSLANFGVKALSQFRGMFAIALYDREHHKLLLARDPLGIKPLYFAIGENPNGLEEIAFASEVAPILGLPSVGVRANLSMISAYLTTIRSVIGNTTLFDGVYSLRPRRVRRGRPSGGTGVCAAAPLLVRAGGDHGADQHGGRVAVVRDGVDRIGTPTPAIRCPALLASLRRHRQHRDRRRGTGRRCGPADLLRRGDTDR